MQKRWEIQRCCNADLVKRVASPAVSLFNESIEIAHEFAVRVNRYNSLKLLTFGNSYDTAGVVGLNQFQIGPRQHGTGAYELGNLTLDLAAFVARSNGKGRRERGKQGRRE